MKAKILFIIALLCSLVTGAQAQHNVTQDATMSEGWSITPDNPVSAGATVTATYGGTRHVKSVKCMPAGHLSGKFTVNASGDKVYFSKGNLQQTGANSWKFADNQWDRFGNTQANNHRDLFGWGTGNNPNQISTKTGDYLSPMDWGENTYLQATLGAGWRTMTQPEWVYLFVTRSASTVAGTTNARYAKAQVNGRHGVILFPDIYTHPAGVKNPVGINNDGSTGWDGNSYSAADWAKMEAAGCVFLPVTGYRSGETVDFVDTRCSYWTYTSASEVTAYGIFFYGSYQSLDNQTNCYQGYSVRLVFPAE